MNYTCDIKQINLDIKNLKNQAANLPESLGKMANFETSPRPKNELDISREHALQRMSGAIAAYHSSVKTKTEEDYLNAIQDDYGIEPRIMDVKEPKKDKSRIRGSQKQMKSKPIISGKASPRNISSAMAIGTAPQSPMDFDDLS